MGNNTQVVYRYVMPDPGAMSNIDIPNLAEFVHFAIQDGSLTAWAAVDPNAPTTRHIFVTVGTGAAVIAGAEHIGTAIDSRGFVWHTFILPTENPDT